MYFGDYFPGQTVNIPWSTNSKQGGSISRAVQGSILCMRASTSTQSAVGVSDTRDVLGAVGVDACSIQLVNAFYAPYDDYLVILVGATVDGESVNATLGEFSILNRSHSRLMVAGTVDSANFAPSVTEFECSDITTEALANNLAGRAVYGSIGNALLKQVGVIESCDVVTGKAHFVLPVGAPLTAAFANGSRIVIV